ncbi:MAG: hypothetical protein IKR48_09375 [Kiritimatiellae bacterium]|nr:hypothetical protein [Kiritimatiellia bacterium]
MSDGQSPKPVVIDNVKPSPEQLRKAYELALKLWELAPWDMPMGENQLLVIKRANGRKSVLSVMGEYGEHRAVAIYPRVSSYCLISAIDPYDNLSLQDAFFSIRQTQVAFVKAANLLNGERAAIKASGVKFPRGVNPSLLSYIPGYDSERMGANELAEAMDAIQVFLDFFKTHSAEDINLIDQEGDLVSVWYEAPDGTWTFGEEEFSPNPDTIINVSADLLDKVAKLPVNKKFRLEIGALPIPCGKSDSGHHLMGRLMIAVDGETQYALGTDILVPPEGREFDWARAVEFVLKVIVNCGCKPGTLGVLGRLLEGTLYGLCSMELNGTMLIPDSECDAVRDVYEFSMRRLGF